MRSTRHASSGAHATDTSSKRRCGAAARSSLTHGERDLVFQVLVELLCVAAADAAQLTQRARVACHHCLQCGGRDGGAALDVQSLEPAASTCRSRPQSRFAAPGLQRETRPGAAVLHPLVPGVRHSCGVQPRAQRQVRQHEREGIRRQRAKRAGQARILRHRAVLERHGRRTLHSQGSGARRE